MPAPRVRDVDIGALVTAALARDDEALRSSAPYIGVELNVAVVRELQSLIRDRMPPATPPDPRFALRQTLVAIAEAARSADGIGLTTMPERAPKSVARHCVLAVRVKLDEGPAQVVVDSVELRPWTIMSKAWPELAPWRRDMARNRPAAEEWARARAAVDGRAVLVRTAEARGTQVDSNADVEARLFAAIVESLDDDEPRLVFADWLADRGDIRAELIRLQCRLARLTVLDSPDERAALQNRTTRILSEYRASLAGDVARFATAHRFRRGFVYEVTMNASAFVQHGERLFTSQPIERLVLKPWDAAALAQIGTAPVLDRVRSLVLEPARGQVRCDVGALGAATRLQSLRELELTGCASNPQSWSDLFSAIRAPRLEVLGLEAVVMSAAGLIALARNSTIQSIRKLDLRRATSQSSPMRVGAVGRPPDEAEICTRAFHTLGSSAVFAKLERLALGAAWDGVGEPALRAWLDGPNCEALVELDLSACAVSDELAHRMPRALPNLRVLDVTGTPMSTKAALGLLRGSPRLESFAWRRRDRAATQALVEAALQLPASHSLRRLGLREDGLDPVLLRTASERFELAVSEYRPGDSLGPKP
ncbi:MAG: TIGR02996 domain-containing protein [Polyangiaceae bacterium]